MFPPRIIQRDSIRLLRLRAARLLSLLHARQLPPWVRYLRVFGAPDSGGFRGEVQTPAGEQLQLDAAAAERGKFSIK